MYSARIILPFLLLILRLRRNWKVVEEDVLGDSALQRATDAVKHALKRVCVHRFDDLARLNVANPRRPVTRATHGAQPQAAWEI